jgi:hypothetical protein
MSSCLVYLGKHQNHTGNLRHPVCCSSSAANANACDMDPIPALFFSLFLLLFAESCLDNSSRTVLIGLCHGGKWTRCYRLFCCLEADQIWSRCCCQEDGHKLYRILLCATVGHSASTDDALDLPTFSYNPELNVPRGWFQNSRFQKTLGFSRLQGDYAH